MAKIEFDCTALWKIMYLIALSIVMLVCYGSAFAICSEISWEGMSDLDFAQFRGSECRFYFYDRTLKFNGYDVLHGDVYVVYYIVIWVAVMLVAIHSLLCVLCKSGPICRRFSALGLVSACGLIILSDVVSIGITYKNYNSAMDSASSPSDVESARATYVGLNIAVLVMQTYIILNAAYDLVDRSDVTDTESTVILKNYKKEVYGKEDINV